MASTYANGSLNGAANGLATHAPTSRRFADIPQTIDIPVQDSAQDQDEDPQAVEVNLEELADDPTELCTLLEMEHAARTYWMTVALAYAKQKKVDFAIEILSRGVVAMQSNQREKLTVITCLCWMYLWKSREAPRVAPEGTDARTKEYYLQQATQSLNDASRLNPAFPPLFLARGVLLLLKASLQSPSQDPNGVDVQKSEHVRNALKSFEEAIRVSHGKNMLASMGKARALFSLAKYQESLAAYQDVLAKMPDLVDPDPRIGVGCCLWQLGYKDDAKGAWERSLEISPDSKIAKILLGLYYLDASSQVPTNSPEFLRYYKKAMTEYTQDSFKRDKNLPLTCATFAGYFLARKQFPNVDSLAHKAIQYTDVNAIASDGWYLLARKEHYEGNLDKASDYYRRADDARGGVERGYLPAKFGLAQLSVLRNDLGEAKLRLEKMIQQSKNLEAMILLGTLYAEEVFANQTAAIKEDKTAETKKALTYLEAVRTAWKDPKKGMLPDAAVLLNLARLYETEFPDRALQCLQQVEQLEIDQVPKSEYPADAEDQAVIRSAIRKHLPPQLLNNIGCFYSQDGRHQLATEYFQAALDSCARISSLNDTEVDTDALLTTISFNLGRSYEYEGDVDRAIETYERLLSRHSNYTDARARLAYIKLRKNPNKDGPDAVAKLYQDNPSDLEVRALYGWFLGKLSAKKRPANINEDPEHRHYKHTLQNYDKHDRYALVGMGNLLLGSAREMRRESEQDRQKRSSMYSRAVEFFDKALQLEPKNAYAAQGVAIALVEDKKDAKTALQAFLKVKETVQDAHVFVNLGHIYTELGQFSKAIESYEIALSKEGKANDAGVLSCLGRTWLNKARTDKKFIEHYNMALEYAQKALKVAPEQAHFKFNVAYVQIMLADTLRQFASQDRNSFQLEQAAEGLEQAIKTLDEIAAGPNPPYPKHDIEQRANMARNTVRNQLNRALQAQKEYEAKNKEKRDAAIQQRQAELRRKEEERRKAEEAERLRQEKIRKEREEIAARDRILAEQRAEEEKARMEAELTTDSETGEKIKRKKRSGGGGGERARRERSGEPSTQRPRKGRAEKKKKGSRRRDETGDEESDAGEGGGRAPPKKRVRLASRKEAEKGGKYKSAEIVVDSSDEGGGGYNGEEDPLERTERKMERNSKRSSRSEDRSSGTEDEEDTFRRGANTRRQRSEGSEDEGDRMAVDRESSPQIRGDDEEEETVTRRQAKRSRRAGRVVDSDEEEEVEGGAGEGGGEKEEEQRENKADVSMADAGDVDEE